MSGAIPVLDLRVNGTPLGPGTMDRLAEVVLVQTCDGSDVLTINGDGWDPIAQAFRLVDDRVLFPGNEVEVWAGYLNAGGYPQMVCKGLFRLEDRGVEYNREGVTVTLNGYDGLQRLMKHTQARVFKGRARCSDIVRYLAGYYGFAADWADQAGQSEFVAGFLASGSDRSDLLNSCFAPATAPLASPHGPVRKAIEDTPEIRDKDGTPSERTKPRGETDLAWLKRMAMGYGYMFPKLRYDPAGPGRRGTEVLVFRRPVSGPDEFSQSFWWRKPGADQSDLDKFSPKFSLQEAPAGIEILGWDRKVGKPIRIITKVRSGQEPEVLWDSDIRADEKIEGEIKNGARLRLSILGTGQQTVKLTRATVDGQTWQPEKNVAEVLTSEMLAGRPDLDRADLEMIAKMWLRQRQAAWSTAEFEMQNLAGLHLMDSDQVHEFRGLAPMDEGHYIVLKVEHRWNPSINTHAVSGELQKLVEDVGEQVTQQRAYA